VVGYLLKSVYDLKSEIALFLEMRGKHIFLTFVVKIKGKVVPVLPLTEHHAMNAY
jgi:hypothetical protein